MKSNVKRLKDCKVQMSVEVEADHAEERYQEVLRGFQRAARLPGFREGKAPVDLIEQRYQAEAREELLKRLAIRGRVDDTPEAIDQRLHIYRQEIYPILSYFTEQHIPIVHIDGEGSVYYAPRVGSLEEA